MKITVAVIAALSCLTLASPPNFAQPDYVQPPAISPGHPKITLHFEDAEVSDIAQAIADQGKVEIILSQEVKGKVKLFHLDKSTPEAALEKLAQATGFFLKKMDEKTYLLDNKAPAPVKIVEVAQVIEKAKPYTIKFRFADILTQEIQVKENDKFGISTTIGDTKWTIRGVNTLDKTGMFVHLDLEWKQGDGAGDVRSSHLGTVVRAEMDGKELFLGGLNSVTKAPDEEAIASNFAIAMSIHKNAP